MRKLIDDDGNGISKGLGMDVSLLLNTARNVPKNPSFLKRDLVIKSFWHFLSKFAFLLLIFIRMQGKSLKIIV